MNRQIGWIERKTKFQIFPIFIFWVMVIFVTSSDHHPNFQLNFTITQKIKIREFFLLCFPTQHTPHLSYTFHHFWGVGGGGSACPSLWQGPNIFHEKMSLLPFYYNSDLYRAQNILRKKIVLSLLWTPLVWGELGLPQPNPASNPWLSSSWGLNPQPQ